MKIYSEKTKEFYDTTDACLSAEEEYDKKMTALEEEKKAKAAARADRAKEVEEALKKVQEATKEYKRLLSEFIKDYGSYHATYKGDVEPVSLFDLFFGGLL